MITSMKTSLNTKALSSLESLTVSEKCKAIDEPDKPVLRVYPIGSDAFVA